MNNLELLKQELINQKNLIESKGGTVKVANINPSPSEITAGINGLGTPDFSASTATELDVAKGKTFYSQNSELKTGNMPTFYEQCENIFIYDHLNGVAVDPFNIVLPTGHEVIRPHLFDYNYNPITFTINEDVKVIGDYAFGHAENATFTNFNDLTMLEELGEGVFAYSSMRGIDFTRLPNSLTKIGSHAFYGTHYETPSFVFNSAIEEIGTYAFAQQSRIMANTLTFPEESALTELPGYMFQFVGFNCDFVVPSYIDTIPLGFNNNGGFKNIILHENVISLRNSCFGMVNTMPVSDCNLETVTFYAVTPPTFASGVFSTQAISKGFKIYVPDESVESYKAAKYFTTYASCVLPMSQKE